MKKIFVFFLISASLQGQNTSKQIDSLLSLYERHHEFMGSVAIFSDGKEVMANAYGFANVEQNKKAQPNTLYKVGSITKIFTAAIVMQLVEEGKISLDAKLNQFYPGVKNADKITIAHLLGHRTGIFNYTIDAEFPSFMTKPMPKEALLKRISGYDSDFEPGSKFEYSNSNYMLLGYIIEDLTKKSFGKNIDKRIISKLKLKHTFYSTATDTRSYGYLAGRWIETEQWNMDVAGAAGALLSTPQDLCLFIIGLFDGKIVSKASLNKMTAIKDGYGLGLIQIPYNGLKGYGHTGGIEDFKSSVFYFPQKKTAIAMCANAGGENNNDIAIGMLALEFGDPFTFPNLEKRTVDPLVLAKYKGVYSSKEFPLKIEISSNDGELVAQATGQSAFPLKSINNNEFTFERAGITLLFKDEKMILKQGGGEFTFIKDAD